MRKKNLRGDSLEARNAELFTPLILVVYIFQNNFPFSFCQPFMCNEKHKSKFNYLKRAEIL